MKPDYGQAIAMLVCITLNSAVIYLLVYAHVESIAIWILLISLLLLFLLFFVDAFVYLGKGQTWEEYAKHKDKLTYNENEFIIDNVQLQYKEVITWESVEAIYLFNNPPGDGEYHNYEYSIVLNNLPEKIVYEKRTKYKKHIESLLPKTEKKGLPIIRINDYRNLNFNTFENAIKTNLTNINLDLNYNLKFGNKLLLNKITNTTTPLNQQNLKKIGFYQIFDRGNNLNDYTINTFRKETENENR
ncbi:hypothetical protein AR687_01930 [Flavobacteriaceae bacterium CRH]|nr:hypothetical protein AR687_01930 [Flavobacteriaceae bacterium CRH]